MRFIRLMMLAVAPITAAVLAAPTSPPAFPPLPTSALDNARYVTDKVLAGAQPEGDAGFAALKQMGVKTIISVDGAKPDIERAHRFGLRYVHLPIGYDDVSPEEGRAIARAIDEVEGPVYVHCHHGKHRSAAAVAVACVMNGRLKPERAESVLRIFGTGENYKGLWASARDARPLPPAELAAVKVIYRETAPIPPLAEAMVEIDQTLDRLKLAEKAGWRSPSEHPDVDPPHEALQLVERLREVSRTHDVSDKPEAFRKLLGASEASAQALQDSLTQWSRSGAACAPPTSLAGAMKSVNASCTACHNLFRDDPARR